MKEARVQKGAVAPLDGLERNIFVLFCTFAINSW